MPTVFNEMDTIYVLNYVPNAVGGSMARVLEGKVIAQSVGEICYVETMVNGMDGTSRVRTADFNDVYATFESASEAAERYSKQHLRG